MSVSSSALPVLLDGASIVNTESRSALWKEKLIPALLSAGIGMVLLYGAAFTEISALHNAAHDGRHSASFPCH